MIPDKFKVAGFDVTVNIVEKTDNNEYGFWDDVNNIIVIAKNISMKNGELTALSERQMENTFYHELYHSFQFYSGREYSEVECNIFANFMLEYNETRKVRE